MDTNIVGGIYKITNATNGKFYIGSTNNLRKRKREHFGALRKGKHVNNHLQRSFNKHGEGNFKFEIIEIITDISTLLAVEQKYLDELKSYDMTIGYNICPITSGGGLKGELHYYYGKHLLDSTKAKISQALMGHEVTEETRKKLSLAGKGKMTGEKHPMYGKVVSDERRAKQSETLKGRFAGSKNPFYGKKHSEENKRKKGKAIVQLTKNGDFINKYFTSKEAAHDNNMGHSHICSCCKGDRKTSGGSRWMYYDDYIKQQPQQIGISS